MLLLTSFRYAIFLLDTCVFVRHNKKGNFADLITHTLVWALVFYFLFVKKSRASGHLADGCIRRGFC